MKPIKSKISPIKYIAAMLFVVFGLVMTFAPAKSTSSKPYCLQPVNSSGSYSLNTGGSVCKGDTVALAYGQCGNGTTAVVTSISFGCSYDHCVSSNGTADGSNQSGCSGDSSAIVDIIFAIIRFLSDGVGIVVIGSIVVGGIQYIASRGEANSTAQAIARIRSSVIALLIFIFSYAILNYIIPVGFFKR